MKHIIEIDETITKTYRIEVDEETANKILEHNDPYGCFNTLDFTLASLTDYHNRGTIVESDYDIDYAVMFEDERRDYNTACELFYNC